MTLLVTALSAAAEAAVAAADDLNVLDAQAGDGDLGITMATAGRAALDVLAGAGGSPPADLLRACGAAIAQKAPSTAGTLVATGLLRAGKEIATHPEVSASRALAGCLEAARAGIAERGKAELGSKTMLDSLAPAAGAAEKSAVAGQPYAQVLAAAAKAAGEGAKATAAMRAQHGRAGWLAERSAGHEDGGARLVAILLDAASRALVTADRAS